MPAFRSLGQSGGPLRAASSGDTPIVGFSPGSYPVHTTDQILTPDVLTGGTLVLNGAGGQTVKFPTASEIYNQLLGNGNIPDLEAGMGFYVDVINSAGDDVALTSDESVTVDAGGDITLILGSTARMFFQFVSIQQPTTLAVTTVTGEVEVSLAFPNPTQTSASIGPSPTSVNLSAGAAVSNAGNIAINAGSRLVSLLYGPAGLTGFELSSAANTTGITSVTVGPKILVYVISRGTL